MEQIISMVVANGLWAVLFCLLLVYELRDSRRREARYVGMIDALAERLGALDAVRADTAEIRSDAEEIKADVKELKGGACKKRKEGSCRTVGQTA